MRKTIVDAFLASSEMFLSLRGIYKGIDKIFLYFHRFCILYLGRRWWCSKKWEDFQDFFIWVRDLISSPALSSLHIFIFTSVHELFSVFSWGRLPLRVSRPFRGALFWIRVSNKGNLKYLWLKNSSYREMYRKSELVTQHYSFNKQEMKPTDEQMWNK